MDEVMEERPSFLHVHLSHRYENKEYLLQTIMNQLGITQEDLENDPSWMKAKVREMNIEKVLEN